MKRNLVDMVVLCSIVAVVFFGSLMTIYAIECYTVSSHDYLLQKITNDTIENYKLNKL